MARIAVETDDEQMRAVQWSEPEQQLSQQSVGDGSGTYVKAMTDEQVELLRQQISVYATICDQLVEMHKTITAQQDLAGLKLSNPYCDPSIASGGHKITARQRWTPSPVQLQILEHTFNQGHGTPSKQLIKQMASKLSQHGQVSETNVYNWFQNRRARSKRKQSVAAPNKAESEIEAEVEFPKEKMTKLEGTGSHKNTALGAENVCFQNHEINAEMKCFDAQTSKGDPSFPSDYGLSSSGPLDHLPFRESVPRIDQLFGKMELPESFGPYEHGIGYDILG